MNKICELCLRPCKQEDAVTVVECKRYRPAPVQMVIKFKERKKGVREGPCK